MQEADIRCTNGFKAAADCAQHAVNCIHNTEMAHRLFITVITVWQGWCLCTHAAHIYYTLLSALSQVLLDASPLSPVLDISFLVQSMLRGRHGH